MTSTPVKYLPRGRDPLEDLCTLAGCIAVSDADLFDHAGAMVLLAKGALVPVTSTILSDIIRQHVVTKCPVHADDKWQVEFRPVEPDDQTLRTLLTARSWEEGGLVFRLPKVPVKPRQLTSQQREEVRQRLRIGEGKERIATHYGVSINEMLRQVES